MYGFFRDKEKRGKTGFFLAVVLATALIFIFNVLTPQMTDDLFYGKEVAGASSLWDLALQEQEQYMTWSGRSVCHMLLRIFLSMDGMVFKVANSLAFTLMTLLIYWNVEHRKRYDIRVYLLINLLVWMFGVVFRQTVLWETGACNYLWGTTIILGFVTLYRQGLRREKMQDGSGGRKEDLGDGAGHEGAGRRTLPYVAGMFLLGILAGWCNENTSGGGILMVLLSLGLYLYEEAGERGGDLENQSDQKPGGILKIRKSMIRPWMIVGLIGQLTGFLFLVLAPGNAMRAGAQEEEHSGWFAYVSRFQKITLAIRDNFLILLIILIVLSIVVRYQRGTWKDFCKISIYGLLWGFVFLATCYALVFTPEPMPRAYFGAGIFLTISVTQFYVDVSEKEKIFGMMKAGLVSVLFLVMFFTYMDCGADLARIYREYRERDAYLAQMADAGIKDVVVPMLRPDFENKYSDGHNSDIEEDPGYWVNVAYAQYYGFDSVAGVPREGWTEY